MSQTLNINNYARNNVMQNTRLTSAIAAGVTALPVQNNLGFSANDYFIIGSFGEDTTELLSVGSVTGQLTITASAATTIAHAAYDYVTKLFGNQVRIYRAANSNNLQPLDSAFTVLTTVDITPDRNFTQYTDGIGNSNYWYKFTYYNSAANAETDLGDSKAVRGGSSGDYCSLDDIRGEAGFKYAPYITDGMIDLKRQAAQDEINGTLQGFYQVPFSVPINPFIADICTRLAAGLLLVEQYGQINVQNTADGQKKIDEARADLTRLATKQVELIDTAGNTMAEAGSTGGVSSWPDATTNAALATGSVDVSTMTEGQDAGHAFKRQDILGYGSRQY